MAGNYSCQAENVFGRDQVVFQIIVMVPPSPPTVAITATSTHSLSIQWKISSNGGSQITGNFFNELIPIK